MPGGRPSSYTEELAAAICGRVSVGESIGSICADEGMPSPSTVFLWLSKHEAFSEMYTRAKEAQADFQAEEMLDIADDGSNDWMERQSKDGASLGWQVNGEAIQRSRLRVETRKWLMSKFKPRKYGDKQQHEHTGEGGGPLVVEVVSFGKNPPSGE